MIEAIEDDVTCAYCGTRCERVRADGQAARKQVKKRPWSRRRDLDVCPLCQRAFEKTTGMAHKQGLKRD